MIEQFKTLMREKFPDYDLSMSECDDERFLDIEVNAMWMMYQICNAWEPIKTIPEEGDFLVYLPDEREGQRILVANYHKNVKVIGGHFAFDRKANPSHWRPLPIPPLTTESAPVMYKCYCGKTQIEGRHGCCKDPDCIPY